MRSLTIYLFLPLLLFTSLLSLGQNNDMLKQYLTVENGLSHNEVTSIVQDNDGFIWIGTRGGLNRYDGYEFQVFNQVPGDSNSLVNPSVETLFLDSKGNIWIGTKSGGVSKYNPTTGRFKNIVNNYLETSNILPSNRILSFYEDSQDQIWMGTWHEGLVVYDEKTNTAKHYLNNERINTIIETTDNRIWVGAGLGGGMYEYIQEADSFIQRIPNNNLFRCRELVYDEQRNVIWVVGGDNIGAGGEKAGLTKYEIRNNKYTSYKIEDSNLNNANLPHSFYSIHIDKNGMVWVGTWGTGLYIFDPEEETFRRYSIQPEHIRNLNRDYDAVLDIIQDKDNNLWLGTNGGGICVLSPKLGFNSVGYTPESNKGLINTRVMSVLEDSTGNLWIGTIGNGLIWSPDRKEYFQVENPALANKSRFFVIKYIYEDDNGTIWVGTNIGAYLIEFRNGEPQMVKAQDKLGNPQMRRTAISFLEAENMFWFGTLQGGLFLMDNQNYETIKIIGKGRDEHNNIQSNRISYLFKDSNERIWLGTYNGLHTYSKQDSTIQLAEEFYNINGGFTGNIITCIDEDQKGNLWVGTPNGLNKLSQTGPNDFEVNYYSEKDGLASNFIKGIACDYRGDIWFSTNVGISKYSTRENRWINFDETDGVLGKGFTEASVYRNTKGEIFFGGTQGLTYFSPEDIIEHIDAPQSIFTGLSILNEPVEIGKKYDSKIILEKSISNSSEIELSHRQNKIEVQFSALDFVSHGKNKYQFLLENMDENWTDIGERRFVIFNNLKPGKYVLKVKSANRHNLWNDEPAQLKITIIPPFWRTWYALLIYILIALGIITVIRWNAVKQVRLANNLEIEKMLHEQDQKMNEMKMRFFTNISHEFRTPLTLILAPLKEIIAGKNKYGINEELSGKLNVIQNNSLRLMRMINQLLDFRKVESGNMKLFASLTNIEDFVSEVCYPFNDLAQINNIKFSSKSSVKTREIWFDRDKLEIVLNNLISNAFKYVSESGIIEVSLYEEEEEVLLSVSDNGPGIPSTELKHIFQRFYQIEKKDNIGSSGIGLAVSKRYVELNYGTISVTSEPNVNTEFVVSLPKGNNHLKPEEIVEVEKTEPALIKKDSILGGVMPAKAKVKVQSDIKILLVDDDVQVRNYLVELLEPLYKIEVAVNGIEGLAKAQSVIPELIISDVMMPEMDGFEFCNKLRSKEATSTIPFIFLTAKSDEQFRLQGTQAGANDYISKPFDPTLLVEKVKNILERYQRLQKLYSRSVRLEPSDVEITSGEEVFITNVIKVIEDNLNNEQFSSEVLASRMNRSYSSLYRKLKKLTGLSAAEFIRSIRIKRAGQLLADKEKTITEIAYEVGFNDIKHFRTVFQKHFGCSPSKYREKL